MLFSVTLKVSAGSKLNDFIDSTLYASDNVSTFFTDYFTSSDSSGTLSSNYDSFEGDYSSPFVIFPSSSTRDLNIDLNAYYYVGIQLNSIQQFWSYSDLTSSPPIEFTDNSYFYYNSNVLDLKNVYFTDYQGNPIGKVLTYGNTGTYRYTFFIKGRDLLNGDLGTNIYTIGVPAYLHFTGVWPSSWRSPTAVGNNVNVRFRPNYRFAIYSLKEQYRYDVDSVSTSDYLVQQELNQLNESTEQIEDSVTNPNGGGILGTIKDFFGGFFNWLKDLLLGLFIPDDDYFSSWFTNLNNLLADKLGMLYAPFDLLITVLNAVYSSSTDFSGVPFPEIRWGDTVLIGSQNLTFSSLLGDHFSEIQGYVYFATDVVLLFAFLTLLERKISLILRGHESG